MNQQHRDILTAIGRKQPITTAGIAEYLMDHFGYGGGMEFDAFRDQVSKTIGYLKSKGEIVGEDIPQAKGKPLRYWALANPQSDCQSAEMASDVAEVEATVKDSLTVADADMVAQLDALDTEREIQERQSVFETLKPVSLEVKAEVKMTPMSVGEAMDIWFDQNRSTNWFDFCAGIRFAEKHHGIGQ